MAMFNSIRSRTLSGTLSLALLPLIAAAGLIGYLSYQSARQSVEDRVTRQLDSLRTVQADQVVSYFDSLKQTVLVLSANPAVKERYRELRDEFPKVAASIVTPAEEQRAAVKAYFTGPFSEQYAARNAGKPVDMNAVVDSLPLNTEALQYLYIARNPNELGKKNNLELSPDDLSGYSASHAALQPFIRRVVDQYGFYDIFLADLDGNIVYTYFKEADYATSLTEGAYADTNIGDAFLAARDADDPMTVTLADYRPYLPSYDDQAAFMSVPIMDGEQKIGVFIAQVPIARVDALMTFKSDWKGAGLEQTGQAFLVGPDKRSRSKARGLIEKRAEYLATLKEQKVTDYFIKLIDSRDSDIGTLELSSRGIDAVVAGKTRNKDSSSTYRNHLGAEVLGSYGPVNVLGLRWGLVAEINESEAFAPVRALLKQIALVVGITVLVLSLIAFYFARRLADSINRPISHLLSTVQEISAGNLDARTHMEPTDELGQLGQAFDNLLDERVSQLVQAAHENEVLNGSVIEIMQSLGQLSQNDLTVKIPVTGDVTGAISDAINLVTSETSNALRQVLGISSNVARASTTVRQRATDVMAAAEKNGVEVTQASRELESTAQALNDIAGQARSANEAAGRAISATGEALKIVSETVQGVSLSRDQIRETEKRLKRLGERSQEITTVVNIINQIAERTSVLALNAGMQAAAAGEAGRGFALVADEVKRLAESARDATRQIGTLVHGIQADSVDTIRTMNDTITQVVEISKLAERAGEQMEKTRTATDGLVGSVREIAATTSTQARTSDSLLKRAINIEQTNRDTLTQLTAQREETNRLMQYAKALVDTVRVFKLPNSDANAS